METDEGSTRKRILEAALDEFAMKGIAGARVETIAKRAGANVRMIYYWFDNKRGLYEAVNAYVISANDDSLEGVSIDDVAADPFRALFGTKTPNPRFIRLLEWEELESATTDADLANFGERRSQAEARIELLRAAQAAGRLPAEIDAAMLYFVMHALTRAPYAFPSLARYATGIDPESAEFAEEFGAFLTVLGRLVAGGGDAPAETQ
ncbi:HTH-type transcriptional repressor [Pseudoclavibacter endophyticus]|uniref:TetR/AcrR family transcriptional regulator n=1 Tax=Pseudoclavibacter endophyticus TaxID=1778590 RepID=A0A6H9WSP4_9MICO|nr:TetR/AcrR family transcriptional regulator [Pseudoclavibacter endophyticus]KAB1649374.1 TetR/AcrR family transcriptional regulator [Pseudoclavibacter endophyticus]GGA63120.1 HTH-type transcriptional repressor [Pseudoclavibacter endophyticus]